MKQNLLNCTVYGALIVFLIAMTDPSLRAATPAPSIDSEQLIRSQFDRPEQNVRLRQSAKSLELCKELCDYFVWSKPRMTAQIWDLVLLYEYQRGIGTLDGIAQSYQPKAKAAIPALLMRYETYCPARANDAELLACVLVQLATRNEVRIGLVEYEAQSRCLAWADVRDPQKISDYECTPAGKKPGW
jgi:hypothetical protein